jgi:hemolysin activation/secretion protein
MTNAATNRLVNYTGLTQNKHFNWHSFEIEWQKNLNLLNFGFNLARNQQYYFQVRFLIQKDHLKNLEITNKMWTLIKSWFSYLKKSYEEYLRDLGNALDIK